MNEFLAQFLAAGAGGGMTGGVLYLLVSSYLNRRDAERDQLVNDVQRLTETIRILKDERIMKIELRVEDHISEDMSQRILTVVEAMSAKQSIIDTKVDRLSENNATLLANDRAKSLYIENLDKSIQRHKQEKHS